jgi:hypothetical protein
MDRFLLAENPIKKPNSTDPDRIYIVHTIRPECIIEVICLNDSTEIPESGFASDIFENKNSDNIVERWILVVRIKFNDHKNFEFIQLLPRAWRWYRSYLGLEDKNINIKEDGEWN